jgi:hypothetical protein
MADEVGGLDVLLLVFVAFAPPAISFFGAAAVTNAAEEVIYAVMQQEPIGEKLIWFTLIWLLIPSLQFTVTSAVARISIYSRLARGLAPWMLAAGFAASLVSIMLYDRFFSMLNEGWKEMTRFAYTAPMFLTYAIAAGRLLFDYD